AERPGGFQIDDKFVLSWRLHRKVGRLLTLEDAVDVAGRFPILPSNVRAIGDEAASFDEEAQRIDRRQPMLSRQANDQRPYGNRLCSPGNDKAAIGRPRERNDGAFDLAFVAHPDASHFNSKSWCCGLDCDEL